MLYEDGSQKCLGAPDAVHHIPRLLKWGLALDEVDRSKVVSMWTEISDEVVHRRKLEKARMKGWENDAERDLPEM